jgi:hypothetical protein
MSVVPHVRPAPRVTAARWLALGLLAGAGSLAGPLPAQAQDTNVLHPLEYITARLLETELRVMGMDRSRQMEQDRSRRVVLGGAEGEPDLEAHWKPVARPGEGFNNEPRYELAAYRFQQMFLDEADYVVPPVVLRAMPIAEYRQHRFVAESTIRGTNAVLFLLSYWIQNLAVDTVDPFNTELFDSDESYARHFANANILTHLIDHKDGNHGNIKVSLSPVNRRVFAVDNDVAFRSRASDLGDRWKRLHVKRLPATTIERLRAITADELRAQLEVVAEFEVLFDGNLRPVEPGPNLEPGRGVRNLQGRVQFGLTDREIRELQQRIERLLSDVDAGRIATF